MNKTRFTSFAAAAFLICAASCRAATIRRIEVALPAPMSSGYLSDIQKTMAGDNGAWLVARAPAIAAIPGLDPNSSIHLEALGAVNAELRGSWGTKWFSMSPLNFNYVAPPLRDAFTNTHNLVYIGDVLNAYLIHAEARRKHVRRETLLRLAPLIVAVRPVGDHPQVSGILLRAQEMARDLGLR